MMTTFDLQKQHLTVEYDDPALLPKRRTTHDAAVEELIQEYPPVEIGSLQVQDGRTYRFDGEKWVLISN